jgi:8-oxo-dGTP pyrophosphatase MutT (NUDIX family)
MPNGCSKVVPEYSSVILLTPKHEVVLQLRDDNPKIVDPNCLSLFAGRLMDGESPEDGARREIKEETELSLGALEFFVTYQTSLKRHGRISESHVFIARDIDVDDITVHQGQGGYRLIQDSEDLGAR